jgi:hypothetical protein
MRLSLADFLVGHREVENAGEPLDIRSAQE